MVAESAIADQTIKLNATARSSRFCELFESYQPGLRRLVAAYVTNPMDREDLLQDIAAGIWKSLPDFRGDATERTWIYRIAHNIAIRSSSRQRARSIHESLIEAGFEHPSTNPGAEHELLAEERRRALMNGVRELAVLDRQIVTLHLEGLSAAEIEDVTGVSRGAVATRLTRIRQRLAERMQAEGIGS
ncbi:MAG TPA: sigma-70 family RNA polymerase sigma factor [Bryobacteraceae bacterium]|jgi:RNA polymerase sigma-70 factor (ECF subfamily)